MLELFTQDVAIEHCLMLSAMRGSSLTTALKEFRSNQISELLRWLHTHLWTYPPENQFWALWRLELDIEDFLLKEALARKLLQVVLGFLDEINGCIRLLHVLECVLCILLFIWEYPCNRRHVCTTMPWTIWPALAVLWGVCWMFYGLPGEDEIVGDTTFWNDENNLLGDLFPESNDFGGTESDELEFGPFFGRGEPVQPDFDGAADIVFDQFDVATLMPLSHSTGLTPKAVPNTLDFIDVVPAEVVTNGSSTVLKLDAPVVGETVNPVNVMVPPQGPVAIGYSHGVERFSKMSDLEGRDLKAEGKAFKCAECNHQCGRKSDLAKHMTVHQPASLFCQYTGCRRSEGAVKPDPFRRQDNLKQHMKTCKHAPANARPSGGETSDESQASEAGTDSLRGLPTATGKRRRETSVVFDGEQDTKRVKLLEAELEKVKEELRRRDEENSWLRKLVDKLTSNPA